MDAALSSIDLHPLSAYADWAGKRNRDPILDVFRQLFPPSGNILELGSGSGAHVNYFAPHFPHIRFQPSDGDRGLFEAMRKAQADDANANVWDPIHIDLSTPQTFANAGESRYDVIFAINLFQAAPNAAADGAAQAAARLLKKTGSLAIYGPFKLDGKYTTPSNEAFDRELLQSGVAGWALKDVRDVEEAANAHGIVLKQRLSLPAGNFMLILGWP
jgi:cyclopropane fatty-acyl-phospholipid synthase-like methyltransferase